MLKARHVINAHKASTIFVVIGLMYYYNNFGIGPYVYLSIHGMYSTLWLLKEYFFPDKAWEMSRDIFQSVVLYLILGPLGYWIAPFLLIRGGYQPTPAVVAVALSIHILGIFFHFCGDCQKYFTLKYRKGLIQEGLFSHSRNINYFGEILIYLAFNIIAHHWLPFLVQAFFIVFVFYPGMKKKDRSLSRYEDFKYYESKTYLLFPKFF